MSTIWQTKWGPRRVRVELPTLSEALEAARGMTADRREQMQLAADLMEQPLAAIKTDAERLLREHGNRSEVLIPRMGRRAVVVERKPARRLLRQH